MRGFSCVPLLLCVSSIASAQRATIESAKWLAGCWEVSSANRRVVERWAAPANGEMAGSSRTLIGGAPRESEKLRLFAAKDTLVYAALPSGQRYTEFRSTTVGDGELVFENPAHDFPQKISYRRVGADSMIARVEGDRAGRRNPLTYSFRKIECTPDTPAPAEAALAELTPLYDQIRAAESNDVGATAFFLASKAAPGFQYLLWTGGGMQAPSATAETLVRSGESARTTYAAQGMKDRMHSLTIERVNVRGDTVAVLVTNQLTYKFPDTAGRLGAAGAFHERVSIERRIDTWVKLGGEWKVKEAAIVGNETRVDGKPTSRDGRPVQ